MFIFVSNFLKMPSTTKENYLKAIYFLQAEKGKVSLSALGKHLQVSVPTVNYMVKKLQENGWVVYEKYKPLLLTDLGKRTATLIIRKHRLAEMYLVEKMGFGWEEVHDIAEEMEHLNSDAFFDRIDELLGYPTADPHGSPIPNKKGKMPENNYKKLADVGVGRVVTLKALANSSINFLHYLNEQGIELGVQFKVISSTSYDKSLTVAYNGKNSVMLSYKVCSQLLVEEEEI